MTLFDSLVVALRGLRANKLRSSLTMLGIIIGVAAVVALMSIGRGTQATITSQIGGMGTNLLFVQPGKSLMEADFISMQGASNLTLDDARAIADPYNCPSVAVVAPEVDTLADVVAGDQDMRTFITGVTPEYEYVRHTPVAQGEFINQHHVKSRSMVCVLGSHAAEYLFQGASPLERSVKIGHRQFRVIGVLESKGGGGLMGGIADDIVIVPITTAQSRLVGLRTAGGSQGIHSMSVQVTDESELDSAKEQITTLLRQRHHLRAADEDDFTIVSQQMFLNIMGAVTGVLTIFLGVVAGISLLVGGIGIMNIMLVSVRERTREIGIRKAVGARRKDILIQFLIEAATLSLGGGMIGLLLGWVGSRMISLVDVGGQPFVAVVSGDIVAIAFGVAVAIGLFFGIYPAYQAARLNPIDALRYE